MELGKGKVRLFFKFGAPEGGALMELGVVEVGLAVELCTRECRLRLKSGMLKSRIPEARNSFLVPQTIEKSTKE